MEGPSNGGLLYHEVQESKLCAVHCVNTALQGPFFSEIDLAALASDLDQKERQMMMVSNQGGGGNGDFLMENSYNVSMGGDFSIQVIPYPASYSSWSVLFKNFRWGLSGGRRRRSPNKESSCTTFNGTFFELQQLGKGQVLVLRALNISNLFLDNVLKDELDIIPEWGNHCEVLEKALGVWDLQVIPLNSPMAEASSCDPELETGFICHLHDHWFCIRKVNGEWYNFNSLYAAPEHLSKFYLSAFLDTLRGSGWSLFVVRGNFPKDCPIPSSNGFGQWLTPDDAQRMTRSCNEERMHKMRNEVVDELGAQEEHDLNAAIAASLLDTSTFSSAETSDVPVDVDAAIAASLMSSAFGSSIARIQDPGNLVSTTIAMESGRNDDQSNVTGDAEVNPDDDMDQ